MTTTATKTIAALAIALGTFGAGTFASVQGAEAAIQTKPAISVAGKVNINKGKAQRAAIKKWTASARARYGSKFSRWSTARGRSIQCRKIAVAWSCRATANPAANIKVCRGVVSAKKQMGHYYSEREVRQRVVRKWSKRASKAYGASFASWNKASNRVLTCENKRGRLTVCRATARVCS
ncbi:MAG: hypothetical protein AAF890_11390 [Pseudomonadota bacterium]